MYCVSAVSNCVGPADNEVIAAVAEELTSSSAHTVGPGRPEPVPGRSRHGQEMVKPAKSFSFDSANFCRYCGRPPG